MKIRVLGRTEMKSDINIDKVKRFGGLNAGICYASKPFFESLIAEDIEKSIKRYDSTIKSFHHSVGNHFEITVLIEGVSKMMAMLLNSFTFYNTSERSGRYTKMGDDPLYNKWFNIFKTQILTEYPNFEEKYAEKLAMENARYVLPIFQRTTTMSYTTSIMEFNYICNWFIRFVKDHADYKNCTDISFANEQDKKYFYENIFSEMLSFVNCIDSCGIRIEGHVDNKDRKVEFFEDSNFNMSSHRKYWVSGRTYEIEDTMTFPAFADLLRHRTYNKNIMAMHNIYPGRDYYIPEIIRGTEYESQWVEELEALAYIPQGKLITIRELGHIDYFILKAKERLCSRVQLEVLRVVKNQISEFSNRITRDPNNDNYEYAKHKLLEIYDFDNHVCKTKCQIVGKCSEPCVFGSSGCFTRKI